MICDLMHEAWLKRVTGNSLKGRTNRDDDISIICYGMDDRDWHIYYRTSDDNMDCFNIIHPSSDFLEWEEESLVDTTDYAWEEDDDKLAKEINEWLEKNFWTSAENAHVETNLHSTVNQMGDRVTQEIHFVCWSVRTIENIDTSLIEQSMFTTLITDKLPRDINTENVAYIRIKAKDINTRPWDPTPLIFHLENDYKATVKDIIPSTIKIGEMIKYRCSNWDMVLIARKHLNAIEW
jgi:hypothetical protein